MIVIFGCDGQLAKAFQEQLNKQNKTFVAFNKKQCDITNYLQLKDVFATYKPKIVINAAAYNLVDECEVNFSEGFKVNALSVAQMAFLSKQFGSFLVHFSTDYVFDGTKVGLYNENDTTNPLNEYGKSKLLGERLLIESGCDYLIFRTSWVYGRGKNNFISKLINWCEKNEILKVAYNEFSIPTSAYDIAYLASFALDKGLNGLYNLVNSGFCSRFEWATFAFSKLKIDKLVYPVDRLIFNLKANRPFLSAMTNKLICNSLNVEIRDWKSALADFLENHYEK
ncbi:dTDP-4-dehydrorhamnose reductase [Desulfurella amilsii]|uniref:dTDP-4-dehydrorhamnose reductase n=1 Tax=Desulfurella amilsii TaxID=1562698 RepID=A0A1X4XZP3_9BACT|nr:dTDP-4-dehydrorhamnose reductase [Desulfurella amilsii]OSS43005.1 dTDP-4-dehydrorhamnose reductase [Desulfurella amilsii]